MSSNQEIKITEIFGNQELLKLPKKAFLCSRRISAGAVLRCYDWAIGEREAGRCVISGFHSPIEKDVLRYLIKGTQPVIVVLARGMIERIDPLLRSEVDKGRLLIVAPFTREVKWVTQETAEIRNRMMIKLADEIVIGYCSPVGRLKELVEEFESRKPVVQLYKL